MITGIGSLPFTNVDEAIDLIFATCPEIPFWPQLPKRSNLENMYTTFLEGVPCIVSDEEAGTAYLDTGKTAGIEAFYEDDANGNIAPYRVSERVLPGFYRFLERLGEVRANVHCIKGQITGPFSLGLGLKDENGKPVIYNYAFFDIIKKALRMKASWIISTVRAAYPDLPFILFFDEPYLVSFGSAYVSIAKEEAITCFNDVLEGLDAKRGIHCCGNTDWSVLLNSDVDIINYDAFNFLDTIFYYRDDLIGFLAKGGQISPGFVPSSETVLTTRAEDIARLRTSFSSHMKKLPARTYAKDWLMTTSCGLGSLTEKEARRAMELLKEIDVMGG